MSSFITNLKLPAIISSILVAPASGFCPHPETGRSECEGGKRDQGISDQLSTRGHFLSPHRMDMGRHDS
jgi:hypothetical protein